MKIALVTDTVSNISIQEAEKLNIHLVPLHVHFENDNYKDLYELETADFYKKMQEEEELPKTSQPVIGEFIEIYEELLEEYDHILSIHLSGGLSGTFASAHSAAIEVNAERITVYDTQHVSVLQGNIVLEAHRLLEKGWEVDAIIERLDFLSDHARGYVAVETLENLVKGGRLSGAAGTLANILKIKPILLLQQDEVVAHEKVRTLSRAIRRVKAIAEERMQELEAENLTPQLDILHGGVLKLAEQTRAELLEKYPEQKISIKEISPVVGVHAGPGALGVVVSVQFND